MCNIWAALMTNFQWREIYPQSLEYEDKHFYIFLWAQDAFVLFEGFSVINA